MVVLGGVTVFVMGEVPLYAPPCTLGSVGESNHVFGIGRVQQMQEASTPKIYGAVLLEVYHPYLTECIH